MAPKSQTTFKPGNTPWNKGLVGYRKGHKQSPAQIEKKRAAIIGQKRTPEAKEKMRQAKLSNPTIYWLGKERPLETRLKLSESVARVVKRGEECNLYVDGKYAERHRERYSARYQNWRRQIYARDNYTCQICQKRGGTLNADHIKPFSRYPSLRYELKNGRTLCLECHRKTPTYLAGSRRKVEYA